MFQLVVKLPASAGVHAASVFFRAVGLDTNHLASSSREGNTDVTEAKDDIIK